MKLVFSAPGLLCLLVISGCDQSGNSTSEVISIANCEDGQSNGVETDVDCGGECAPCADESICLVNTDCQSGICSEGACGTSSCDDGVSNGDEVDVDCGGSCSEMCAAGLNCQEASDCDSSICSDGLCAESACDDGVLNGDEVDTDCGAGCPLCAAGAACSAGDDCESGICSENACEVDPRSAYPEGPFATAVGDIVENLSFLDTEGEVITLSDFRANREQKLLFLVNTTEWCGACAQHTPEMNRIHDDYAERGLTTVLSIFEDNRREDATAASAARYQVRHELRFTTVADPGRVIYPYFENIALPMIMIVDLETMELIFSTIGWVPSVFLPVIEENL